MSPFFSTYLSSFAFANPLSNFRSYLPSTSDISNLGENLQSKLLTYALKQGLSRFVLGFDKGSSRYDGLQVADGEVELETLQLRAEALNSLLPSSNPFDIVTGSVSRVKLAIPRLFSLSTYWASAESSVVVEVDHVELNLRVKPSLTRRESKEPSVSVDESAANQSVDALTASIIDVAQSFVVEEGLGLAGEAPITEEADPFSYSYTEDATPGAFPSRSATSDTDESAVSIQAGLLASFIQALLSRLTISVSRITINLTWSDPLVEGADRHLQLRLRGLAYRNVRVFANQANQQANGGAGTAKTSAEAATVSRSFQVDDISLFISSAAAAAEEAKQSPLSSTGTLRNRSRSRSRSPGTRSTSNSRLNENSGSSASRATLTTNLSARTPDVRAKEDDSSSETSDDGNDDLAMSMAVSDLRAENVDRASGEPSRRLVVDSDEEEEESNFDGGQSLYESAIDDSGLELEDQGPASSSAVQNAFIDWVHFASFDGRALKIRANQATSSIEADVGLLRVEGSPRDVLSVSTLATRFVSEESDDKPSPNRSSSQSQTTCNVRGQGCDIILHQGEATHRIFASEDLRPNAVETHHRLCVRNVRYHQASENDTIRSGITIESVNVLGSAKENGKPIYQPLFAFRHRSETAAKPIPVDTQHRMMAPIGQGTLQHQPTIDVRLDDDSKRICMRSLDCQIDLAAVDSVLATVNEFRSLAQTLDFKPVPRRKHHAAHKAGRQIAPSWIIELDDWRIRMCTRLGSLRKTPLSRPATPFPLLFEFQSIIVASDTDTNVKARMQSRSDVGTRDWSISCQAFHASLEASAGPTTVDNPFLSVVSTDESATGPGLKAQLRSGVASQALVRMQAVRISLDQQTSHCLQYAADDLTRYLDNIGGDGKTSPREDLRMVGSRFFGPMVSDSAWLEAASNERGLQYSAMLDLAIEQVKLDIESIEQDQLSVAADALTVKVKKASSFLEVNGSLFDLEIWSAAHGEQAVILVPRGDASRGPILDLRLLAGSHRESEAKETNADVTINGGQFRTDLKHKAVLRVVRVLKSPDGVFENMVPSDVMRTSVTLRKCSALYTSDAGEALLATVSTCQYRTINTDIGEDSSFVVSLSKAAIYAADPFSATDRLAALKSAETIPSGFARIGDVRLLDARGRKKVSTGSLAVEVLRSDVACHLCSDSLETMCTIFLGLPGQRAAPKKAVRKLSDPGTLLGAPTWLGSVDESAFSRPEGLANAVDLRAYDLPSHLTDSAPPRRSSFDFADDVEMTRTYDRPFTLYRDYSAELLATSRAPHQRLPKCSLSISNSDITLSLHSGYDWTATREAARRRIRDLRLKLQRIRQIVADGQTAKVEDLQEIQEETDWLNHSVYVAFPKSSTSRERDGDTMSTLEDDLEDLDEDADVWAQVRNDHPSEKGSSIPLKLAPNLLRSARPQVDFKLTGIDFRHESYDRAAGLTASTRFSIARIEILDHLRTSTWNKFLTDWPVTPDSALVETGSTSLTAALETYGIPGAHSSESRLKVRICPLRFYVDQDTLGFLTGFFSARHLSGNTAGDERQATPSTTPDQTFFQYVEIAPIRLKLDYKPKRVDVQGLRKGRIMQLINFFHFEASEMVFRHVILRGVSGWSTLYYRLNEVWAPDVRANQMSDILSGITPIRSLVNVGTGVVDLVLLPVDQYRKEGKWQRGAKLGAKSFAQSAALEAINLGGKLATGTQVVLEKAESVLGGRIGSKLTAEAVDDERSMTSTSRYADQPANFRQGLTVARERLTSNMRSAAQTILAVPMEMYEPSDEHGQRTSLKPVVRAVPVAVLQGMIGVTDASRNALFGLRNQLDPHLQLETAQKYKPAS